MKRFNYLLFVLVVLSFATACKNVNYKKTKSGLLYKIFPSDSKDSLMRNGNVVKYQAVYKLNDDSVLFSSYDQAPYFDNVRQVEANAYNMAELFPLMKKGDSAVTVQFLDSLAKRGAQIPFPIHKGDRLVTHFKIINVFASDSAARPDFNEEMRKVQQKEQDTTIARNERSGEGAREIKEMETWLASKNINAKKTGKGTFVYIQDPGTGPAAEIGKYLKIKYTGKIRDTDSTFESNVYPSLKLGVDVVIRGWTDGLQLFHQGGKGTIFIPGFLAYADGKNSPFKPFESLKFDVEILEVSDQPIVVAQPAPPQQPMPPQQ